MRLRINSLSIMALCLTSLFALYLYLSQPENPISPTPESRPDHPIDMNQACFDHSQKVAHSLVTQHELRSFIVSEVSRFIVRCEIDGREVFMTCVDCITQTGTPSRVF